MPGTCARGRRLDSCGLYLLRAQIESPFSFLVFFFVVHGNLQFANGKLRSKFSDAGWLFWILYRDGFGNNSRRCCCGRQNPFLHELRNNSFTLVSVELQGNVGLERKPTIGGWVSWDNVHYWGKQFDGNYNIFVQNFKLSWKEEKYADTVIFDDFLILEIQHQQIRNKQKYFCEKDKSLFCPINVNFNSMNKDHEGIHGKHLVKSKSNMERAHHAGCSMQMQKRKNTPLNFRDNLSLIQTSTDLLKCFEKQSAINKIRS